MKKLYLIIGATILGVGAVAFAGYKMFAPQSFATKTPQPTSNTQSDSFAACIAKNSKLGEDPSVANDFCINLENQQKMANTQTQSSPSFIPVVETSPSGSTGCAVATLTQNAFTALPFDIANIKLVTLGKETNDPRFVYPWVKSGKVNIYAPADGTLYKIRHKVFEVGGEKGNDYDMFFQVDCGTVYRFNHISDPRSDIKATYPAGDLPSGDYANGGPDIEERVKPKAAIQVKAGEPLGATSGTPGAHDFDFAVGVAKENDGDPIAVCPFSVFTEPHKTKLMNLLGPKSGNPTPGYPCDIEAKKF